MPRVEGMPAVHVTFDLALDDYQLLDKLREQLEMKRHGGILSRSAICMELVRFASLIVLDAEKANRGVDVLQAFWANESRMSKSSGGNQKIVASLNKLESEVAYLKSELIKQSVKKGRK